MGDMQTCGRGSEYAAFTGRVTHPRSLLSTWHDLQGLSPPTNTPNAPVRAPCLGLELLWENENETLLEQVLRLSFKFK